jgi:hypothetical protein
LPSAFNPAAGHPTPHGSASVTIDARLKINPPTFAFAYRSAAKNNRPTKQRIWAIGFHNQSEFVSLIPSASCRRSDTDDDGIDWSADLREKFTPFPPIRFGQLHEMPP